jgi:hypothetical protein
MSLLEHFANEASVEVDEHAAALGLLCDPRTDDHHFVRPDATSRFGRLSHSRAR